MDLVTEKNLFLKRVKKETESLLASNLTSQSARQIYFNFMEYVAVK